MPHGHRRRRWLTCLSYVFALITIMVLFIGEVGPRPRIKRQVNTARMMRCIISPRHCSAANSESVPQRFLEGSPGSSSPRSPVTVIAVAILVSILPRSYTPFSSTQQPFWKSTRTLGSRTSPFSICKIMRSRSFALCTPRRATDCAASASLCTRPRTMPIRLVNVFT